MAIDRAYTEQLRADVAAQLPKVVPAADSSRLDGFDAAISIETAHYMALSIGRGRAAAKYGAASAQVKDLDARLNAAAARATAVRTAREQALVESPVLPPNSAGVFGRVVDSDGVGIVGAVVEALDAKLAPIQHATTQDGGTYQLVLTVGVSSAREAGNTEVGRDSPAAGSSPTAQPAPTTRDSAAVPGPPAATALPPPPPTQPPPTQPPPAPPPPTLSVSLRATVAGKATLTSPEVLTLHVGDTVFRQLEMTALPSTPPPPPAPPPAPATRA
jgi:hypothetical protein